MRPGNSFGLLAVVGILLATAGCASSGGPAAASPTVPFADALRPTPDPRIGLSAGILNAGQAIWNMRLLSTVATPEPFVGANNSDLAFKDSYVIQGNYRGFQVWDISDPAAPELLSAQICPGAQGDVSVYGNLLFVSTEYLDGRLDCGAEPSNAAVSPDRLRGIRIFDISDIRNPEYIASVQTCRGSHTHSLLVPPDDPDHVYVYVSGSAPVRPAEEMPGCSDAPLSVDPNSSLFRIEVIRVPLADPSRAEIVSSPRIFADLGAPPLRSPTEAELADIQARRQREFANGQFVAVIDGAWWRLAPETATMFLDSIVAARGGSGAPTAADSLALFEALPELLAARLAAQGRPAREGPDQCHDITIYPAIGLAGGACEGFGLLLDISNPIDPRRIAAAADTNFSYWHSATFNNDGTKVLFGDEWGGGGGARCRETDPPVMGANAIFTVENGELVFQSYYKLPVPQTAQENCVAHNGSIIPVPGRDIMVQGWYQGGITVFDWTDPANPFEIAFFDRGPLNESRIQTAGSWSAYWYNGVIVSSEIARGLDILELTPSDFLTQNEIEAAKSARLEYLNVQGQQRYVWPASFVLARAYVDQLERSGALAASRITAIRQRLAAAEATADGDSRRQTLLSLASQLDGDQQGSRDPAKIGALATVLRELAASN